MSEQSLRAVLEKLCKWRTILAGWQLGTRQKGDPESDAVRDREVSILLRAEVSALLKVLIDKGVCTEAEFQDVLEGEAKALDAMYEEKFPGFRSTPQGMEIDVERAKETTKNWRP